MTDDVTDIDDYERVRWDQTLWMCTECEGRQEPLADPDRNRQRLEVDC